MAVSIPFCQDSEAFDPADHLLIHGAVAGNRPVAPYVLVAQCSLLRTPRHLRNQEDQGSAEAARPSVFTPPHTAVDG